VQVLPAPAHVEVLQGGWTVSPQTSVVAASDDPAVQRIAEWLASYVRRGTGLPVPAQSGAAGQTRDRFVLSLDPASQTGDEGYELTIDSGGATLKARTPAGLFYGVQTIRQMLPYRVEYEAVMYQKPRPVTLPAVRITDAPRYAWRGAMLDVARHFFPPADIKRYVDLLALHKINRLHLHLADDQGWRIEIKSRPRLTEIGAASEVGGGRGGFYSQAEYADLVHYAADRYVTIVPEIDMPGHTNAALSSYGELSCTGIATVPYTATDVGFSALCVNSETTYKFIDDVVREIAAMTPGPYFHAGGDEVKTLTPEQYRTFVTRVQQIVQAHGKQMVGWDEIAAVSLLPSSIVQHWRPHTDMDRLAGASHLILSPADHAYIDMKYDEQTALGLNWAGLVPIRQAYDWDPTAIVPGLPPDRILGVEAPLWAETLGEMRDVEFLAFPRMAAIADLAWAPPSSHNWEQFETRLAAQAPRWTALGVNFYRAPEIPWAPVNSK
jgi:hexosaminidase